MVGYTAVLPTTVLESNTVQERSSQSQVCLEILLCFLESFHIIFFCNLLYLYLFLKAPSHLFTKNP